MDELTPDEEERLNEFPTQIYLSDDVIADRQAIGKKVCRFFARIDDTMDERTKKVYEEFPLWCFYEDKETGIPKRVYGVYWMSDGTYRLRTVACLTLFSNDAINGTSPDSLRKVDRWNEEQLLGMTLNKGGYAYSDPLGFFHVIEAQY